MTFMEWVQSRLLAHGFDPKGIDGLWGRNTFAALLAFKKSRGLALNERIDDDVISRLRQTPDAGKVAPPTPKPELYEIFPWMQIALSKKGLQEGRDNSTLRTFLKSDGKTLGDPAKLPWCGDFVETCIALALPKEPLPVNPYLAANWDRFGRSVEPGYGCVMRFWRGSRTSVNGHVAFYYAEDVAAYHVLGGNQSNSISVTRIAKNRLVSARMPLTAGPVARIKVTVAANGEVSTNEA